MKHNRLTIKQLLELQRYVPWLSLDELERKILDDDVDLGRGWTIGDIVQAMLRDKW